MNILRKNNRYIHGKLLGDSTKDNVTVVLYRYDEKVTPIMLGDYNNKLDHVEYSAKVIHTLPDGGCIVEFKAEKHSLKKAV